MRRRSVLPTLRVGHAPDKRPVPRGDPNVADRRSGSVPSSRDVIRRLAPEEDPVHVEAWMCREHGDLTRIDAIYFAREVKAAVERVHAASPGQSEALAQSYGLGRVDEHASANAATGT